MDLNIELLAKKAIEAKEHAYVPYSHFRVGAALLTADGKIYTGMQHRKCRVHTDELCGADGVFQGGIRRGA